MPPVLRARTVSLDNLANLAIIVAAVVATSVWLRSANTSRPPAGVDSRQLYAVGDTIEPGTGLAFDASLTAVIFVHSQCQFCTRSMPFYQQLLSERDKNASGTRVIVAAKESPESLAAYLREHELQPDEVVALDLASPFRLQLTPTLLLVERGGRIRDIWTGQLMPEQEPVAIRAALNSPSARSPSP